MRSPLASIISGAKKLEEKYDTMKPEQVKELVSMLHTAKEELANAGLPAGMGKSEICCPNIYPIQTGNWWNM